MKDPRKYSLEKQDNKNRPYIVKVYGKSLEGLWVLTDEYECETMQQALNVISNNMIEVVK